MPNRNNVGAIGYLSYNWAGVNDGSRCALVVNPAALPIDLLAWCWGEMQSVRAAAELFSASPEDVNVGDFSAIFLQRLGPISEVLELAIDEISESGDRAARAAA